MFGNGIQFEGSTYLIIIEIYGSRVEIDPHTCERCFLPTDSFIDSSDWMSTLDGKSVLMVEVSYFTAPKYPDANVISFSIEKTTRNRETSVQDCSHESKNSKGCYTGSFPISCIWKHVFFKLIVFWILHKPILKRTWINILKLQHETSFWEKKTVETDLSGWFNFVESIWNTYCSWPSGFGHDHFTYWCLLFFGLSIFVYPTV